MTRTRSPQSRPPRRSGTLRSWLGWTFKLALVGLVVLAGFAVYLDARDVVKDLGEFLRIPSISSDPRHADAMKACAAWLAGHLRRIGMERATAVPTPGHPVVYAEWRRAAGRSGSIFR